MKNRPSCARAEMCCCGSVHDLEAAQADQGPHDENRDDRSLVCADGLHPP